jgi:hypothetical protein
MLEQPLLARQLERYRRLLYGATDPLLLEGLRKVIAELEAKIEPLRTEEPVPPSADGESDLLEPAS